MYISTILSIVVGHYVVVLYGQVETPDTVGGRYGHGHELRCGHEDFPFVHEAFCGCIILAYVKANKCCLHNIE